MEANQLLKIGLSSMLLIVVLTVKAQDFEIPQKEFSIVFSKDSLDLSSGEKGQLDIIILKSKGYRKSNIKMGVSSILPKGVTITFDPSHGHFDETKANVLIETDATPGQYLIILNATLNYKTKGAILNLIIR